MPRKYITPRQRWESLSEDKRESLVARKKARYFTMALHENYGHVLEIFENDYFLPVQNVDTSVFDPEEKFKRSNKAAYICHDKDEGSRLHYHFYLEYENPRSLGSISEEFGVPLNMIEIVRNKKGIINYLTHNTPAAISQKKHMYDENDICANYDIKLIQNGVDLMAEMAAYEKVMAGDLTWKEFVMSHNVSFTTLRHLPLPKGKRPKEKKE